MDLKESDVNSIRICVTNLARKFGVPEDSWEDLAQDVILYILENLSTYDESRTWGAWLYAVSRNTTLRFVMKYKIPVVIPKSTWQRQTSDMKNSPDWSRMSEAVSRGFDPTISRIFIERRGVSVEYRDEAGYIFRDTLEKSSPYKLYEEAVEELDLLTQLMTIAKRQHPTIDWWFDT